MAALLSAYAALVNNGRQVDRPGLVHPLLAFALVPGTEVRHVSTARSCAASDRYVGPFVNDLAALPTPAPRLPTAWTIYLIAGLTLLNNSASASAVWQPQS